MHANNYIIQLIQLRLSSGAGCSKVGLRYPLDSDFFNRCKNPLTAMNLQILHGMAINKKKFNFKISKFNLGQTDERIALASLKKSLPAG